MIFKKIFWLNLLAMFLLVGCSPESRDNNTSSVSGASSPEPTEAKVKAPAPTMDVKSVLALTTNFDAGKKIAQDLCSNCHGKTGGSDQVAAPFIAGQPFEYLVRAQVAYLNGDRSHISMQEVVKELNAQSMADVAMFYSKQDKKDWKSADIAPELKFAITPALIRQGKEYAEACSSCHGNGVSERAGIPSLAGLHSAYFLKTMQQFFNGERPHKVMKLFSYSVNPAHARALAAYYQSLPPQRAKTELVGNATSGFALAQRHCAGCHGTKGNSIAPLMPSLAGQDAAYLVNTTMDYAQNKRRDHMMAKAVKGLSQAQIENISAYYASQSPSPYRPAKYTDYSETHVKLMADAKKIAESCEGCHSAKAVARNERMPSLAGLSPEYLVAAALTYKTGSRRHKEMELLLEYMSIMDIEKVSYFYATQPTDSAKHISSGNVELGGKQAALCASCHDRQGKGVNPLTPVLAGQRADYLMKANNDYIDGRRQHPVMRDAILTLPKEVLENISSYYAMQSPPHLDIPKPIAPATLAEGCNTCHGAKGYSKRPDIPHLAGQSEAYLMQAMQEYRQETRKSSPQHVSSIALSQLEKQALASYYAHQ